MGMSASAPGRRRPGPGAITRALLVPVGVMALIVGAACQPLQPEAPSGPAAPAQGRPGPPPAAPPSASAPGQPGPRSPMAALPRRVALILPLSGRQQSLGQAVRDGFLASWYANGRTGEVILIDDAASGGAEAYRRAIEGGADLVVGPLLKESVQAASGVAGVVPTLALNYLGDGERAPVDFYQFGLAPEDEAAEIAARALALNQRRAVALVPDSDWGRRLLAAFSGGMTSHGGEVLAWRFYDPGTGDYSAAIQTLFATSDSAERQRRLAAILGQPLEFSPRRRQDADLIFVAANMAAGRQIGPQLRYHDAGDLPAYSTSAIFDDGSRSDTDLDGFIFPDIPWVIDPSPAAVATKDTLRRFGPPGALALSRLYALGFDADGLAYKLGSGTLAGGLQGMTGELIMDPSGRVHRHLAWAAIRDGRPVPLPATP